MSVFLKFLGKKKIAESDVPLDMEMQRQRERLKLIEMERKKREQLAREKEKENINNTSSTPAQTIKTGSVKRVNIVTPNREPSDQTKPLTADKKAKRKIKFKPKQNNENSLDISRHQKNATPASQINSIDGRISPSYRNHHSKSKSPAHHSKEPRETKHKDTKEVKESKEIVKDIQVADENDKQKQIDENNNVSTSPAAEVNNLQDVVKAKEKEEQHQLQPVFRLRRQVQ